MTIEEATEELLDLVYDPPIFHSDPYAQRKSVETSILDILEGYEPALPPVCPECSQKDRELDRLTEDTEDLQGEIDELTRQLRISEELSDTLQGRNISLRGRLIELEGE